MKTKSKPKFKKKWQRTGRVIYFLVGAAGIFGLGYMISHISTFFTSMGFWASAAYILVEVGALNWLVKAIFGKDLFGN